MKKYEIKHKKTDCKEKMWRERREKEGSGRERK